MRKSYGGYGAVPGVGERCRTVQGVLRSINTCLIRSRAWTVASATLSRASIDALKLNFKDALEKEDWRLVVKMKKVFNI